MNDFIVTDKAKRPASEKNECFYCHSHIGEQHKKECVLIRKKVKVRVTIEYEIVEPASWDKDKIEFHRNESSWCCSNIIGELKEIDEKENCLCLMAKTEYLCDVGDPYLYEE